MSAEPLPEYEDPPVIETVLGVEFSPLEKWSVPHFGLMWATMKADFPRFEVKPPLDSSLERFLPAREVAEPRIEFLPQMPIRCWFLDEQERTLVQVQKNRFTYNWRKSQGFDPYPRYEQNIRPAFETAWRRFADFVKDQEIGPLEVLQTEVTYVNHLEIDREWRTLADLARVFPCWSGSCSGDFLPVPESVNIHVNYLIPEQRGRLRISVQPAIRNSDGMEILQLTLTARVKPELGTGTEFLDSLDVAREWVVRGFTDFTSREMHNFWKRRT